MRVVKSAEPRIVDLLVSSGVKLEVWGSPKELSETRPGGNPFNHDDLLTFHQQLEGDVLPPITEQEIERFHQALFDPQEVDGGYNRAECLMMWDWAAYREAEQRLPVLHIGTAPRSSPVMLAERSVPAADPISVVEGRAPLKARHQLPRVVLDPVPPAKATLLSLAIRILRELFK
jgi:hypothetical protein